MPKAPLAAALRDRSVLLFDGAWGTELFARGVLSGACLEALCLSRPDLVRGLAEGYLAAGSELVGANSFGAIRFRLTRFGMASRAAELAEAAAALSREARDALGSEAARSGAAGGPLVLGSIGPSGLSLERGEVGELELEAAYAETAEALARGGADALCFETMMDAREASLGLRAARLATGLDLVCSFSFALGPDGAYRTIAGQGLEEAARAALEAGASVLGANCGSGSADVLGAIRALHAAFPGFPLMAKPSAGLPVDRAGELAYPEGPELAASYASSYIDAGAVILGGCCGAGPAHVAALRRALDGLLGSGGHGAAQGLMPQEEEHDEGR
jgi:5-methyltetrahydrofolate--homocysteine methyltransferase